MLWVEQPHVAVCLQELGSLYASVMAKSKLLGNVLIIVMHVHHLWSYKRG
jgi:hypothetical protein